MPVKRKKPEKKAISPTTSVLMTVLKANDAMKASFVPRQMFVELLNVGLLKGSHDSAYITEAGRRAITDE